MPVCWHGHVSSLPIAAGVLSLVAVCSAQGLPPDVQELGVALAARGVPAGLVIPEEAPADATEEYPSPAVQAAARARALFATGALPAVLSRFNAASASLRATEAGGVVHVRSLDEPHEVRAALERRVYMEEADDVPVMEAVFTRVLGMLAGREPQGFIGSVVTRPGEDPSCPPARQVRLGGEGSIVDVLDGVVRQVPGTVWLVTYDRDSPTWSLEVGLICADGSNLKADVDF